MQSSSPSPGRNAGFTLIEVLIALAIAGLMLGTIAAVFGTGVMGQETAADANTALVLAEGKLAGAEAAASVRTGRTSGTYGGRFDWQVSVSGYEDAATKNSTAPNTLGSGAAPANFQLYRFDATVAWGDGRRRRQLALSTLRFLPTPP